MKRQMKEALQVLLSACPDAHSARVEWVTSTTTDTYSASVHNENYSGKCLVASGKKLEGVIGSIISQYKMIKEEENGCTA